MFICKEAEKLLYETELLDLLSTCGSAHIVGSCTTDTMVYNDLDIYMDNTALTAEKYHALAASLLHCLSPIRFDGFLDVQRSAAFIGMETSVTGERWNIDIWWKSSESIQAAKDDAQYIITRMDAQPELRTAVLVIKKELCKRKLYGLDKGKKHYHSQEIYDAVFHEGILTTEEFMHTHPV